MLTSVYDLALQDQLHLQKNYYTKQNDPLPNRSPAQLCILGPQHSSPFKLMPNVITKINDLLFKHYLLSTKYWWDEDRDTEREGGNYHYLLDSRGTLRLKFWRGLFYSLPSRLISFLLSFWHHLLLANILQCQTLLGCFLILYLPWVPASWEGIGKIPSLLKFNAGVPAVPRPEKQIQGMSSLVKAQQQIFISSN